MNVLLKALAVVALMFVGLVGLGMSLCGGVVTVTGLIPSWNDGPGFNASGLLLISIPSLIGGLGITSAAFMGLRRLARGRKAREARAQGDDAR